MNSTRTRLIVIGLVFAATIYFLWPTYRFYQLDAARQALVVKRDSVGLARWDMANKDAWQSAKEHRIKLGLDLRGGVYITMEVDIPTMLYESAQRDAVDETFEQVIAATRREAAQSDRPVLDIFLTQFDNIAKKKGKTLLSYYDVGELGNDVSDEAVISRLRKNVDDAVDQAEQVIRQRIDRYGVSETTIQKVGGRRLVIELPGVTDKGEITSLLQTTARLEFKPVHDNLEAVKALQAVDRVLAGKVSPLEKSPATKAIDTAKAHAAHDSAGVNRHLDSTAVASRETTAVATKDSAKATDTARVASTDTGAAHRDSAATAAADTASDTSNPYAGLPPQEVRRRVNIDHPLGAKLGVFYQQNEESQGQETSIIVKTLPQGIYNFSVAGIDRDKIKAMFNRPEVKAVWPEDLTIAFSAQPFGVHPTNPDSSLYSMYVVARDPELTGEAVTDARPSFDQTGKAMVLMEMNADGAETWANITGRNLKKRVAIILDSAVYSAPVVQSKITGGSSQITGSKDSKEANLLAVVLKAGALKAPVKIIEDRQVGPSLGEDSIKQGINATLLAAALVIVFMLLYYAYGGFIADVAVMFNLLITLALLAAFNATLTLPGIGGLVLTIGMAVDGNVLIYERIREELAAGRSLKQAVELGYQKAWQAIIDTHITTFLTGAILFWFGTGPIQGFAVTLMIGIAATLFTAVFATRTVFMLMLDRGTTSISFGQSRSLEPARA